MTNSIPLWLRFLRIYGHYSPIHRGKMRLIDWTFRHLSIPPLLVEAKLDQSITMSVNLQIWVDYNIYCWGQYEYYLTRFFKQQIKPDTIFIDVGAYIGQYAQLAARIAHEGKIYAFEPNPETVQRLKKHIAANQFENITVIPKGVGMQNSTLDFFVGEQPSQSSFISTHTSFKQVKKIPVITLDSFCEEEGIKQVDILKIDVEEAEDGVINGARNLLQHARPLIIMEIGHRAIQSGDPESLQALRALNYKFYILERTYLQPLPQQLRFGQEIIAIPA